MKHKFVAWLLGLFKPKIVADEPIPVSAGLPKSFFLIRVHETVKVVAAAPADPPKDTSGFVYWSRHREVTVIEEWHDRYHPWPSNKHKTRKDWRERQRFGCGDNDRTMKKLATKRVRRFLKNDVNPDTFAYLDPSAYRKMSEHWDINDHKPANRR
jgi:hypothetical protein